MASVKETKAVINQACTTLETNVIRPLAAAAEYAHGERNVLRVALDESTRDEIREALNIISQIFEQMELGAEKLSAVVDQLRHYAAQL